TLVGALTNTASTNQGAQQLVRMLDDGRYDGSVLDSVTSLFGGGVTTQTALGAGKGILDSLFGPKISSVGDLIARFAGVRSESASSLLALAAPLVLHVLGKQRASIAPGAASLASLLGGQKTVLAGMMPPGLNSLLGWSGLTSETSAIGSSPAGAASRVTEAVRKLSELQLPDGVKISVPEGSFNFSVANWLASTTDTSVPKRFLFEDLNFETGSTGLTTESNATVNSLVAVLKAYPSVSVALEGHTDNTGDPIANKTLSVDRAVAVKELMVKGGIPASRITSAGYGQEN